ncbi:hypothetical protein AKO1_007114 [Acrasis kona]
MTTNTPQLRQLARQYLDLNGPFGLSKDKLLYNVNVDIGKAQAIKWVQTKLILKDNNLLDILSKVQADINSRINSKHIRLYTFPLRAGRTHIFPNDWQRLFEFLDVTLRDTLVFDQYLDYDFRAIEFMRTGAPDVFLTSVPPRRHIYELLWLDLVYNERMKDQKLLWRMERILNILDIDPLRSDTFGNRERFNYYSTTQGLHNSFVGMNIAKSKWRKKQRERSQESTESSNNDDSTEAMEPESNDVTQDEAEQNDVTQDRAEQRTQEELREQVVGEAMEGIEYEALGRNVKYEDEIEKGPRRATCAKVLLVLLHFIDLTPNDNKLVRVYLGSMKERLGSIFTSCVLFVLYIMHYRVGSILNWRALDFLHRELSNYIVARFYKEHLPEQ